MKQISFKRMVAFLLILALTLTLNPQVARAGEAAELQDEDEIVLETLEDVNVEDEVTEGEEFSEFFEEDPEEALEEETLEEDFAEELFLEDDADAEEQADAELEEVEPLGDPEIEYSGGTKDKPDVIGIPEDLGKKYYVMPNDDQENFYYKFEFETAGTLTMSFEDDSKYDSKWTTFAISNTPHYSDSDIRSHFALNMRTNDWHNFAQYPVTWTSKDLNSFQTSFIAGTYYLWVAPDDGVTFKFSFDEFKPLEKMSEKEELLVDTKLGGTDHGTNDYYDFLENEMPSDMYYKNPMPSIELGKNYRAILTDDSQEDYYHFTLKKASNLYLTAASETVGSVTVEIYYTEKQGGETVVQKETMSPDFDKHSTINLGKLLSNYQLKNRLSSNHNKDSASFKAGEYAIHFIGGREDAKNALAGPTGVYTFTLSTGKQSNKAVSKLKLDKTSMRLAPEGEAAVNSLIATVTPAKASITSVSYSVEPAGIVVITQDTEAELKAGQTKLNVKAVGLGVATITVRTNGTNKKGKHLEATCSVSVLEMKECPPVAAKQKVDLYSDDYLGGSYDKKDKWLVEPKGYGKVSKGVFTGKKEGWVTVTRQQKEGKKTVDLDVLTFYVATPKYLKQNEKKKDIKTVEVGRRGEEINVNEYIGVTGIELYPTSYESSDKNEKVVILDKEKGTALAVGAGKAKITALYGEGKNAAKIALTIKVNVPVMKENVTIKQGKTQKISITKLDKSVKLTAANWSVKEATYSESLKSFLIADNDTDIVTIEPVATKGNYVSCNVTAGDKAGYAAVIVEVNGDPYITYITVP